MGEAKDRRPRRITLNGSQWRIKWQTLPGQWGACDPTIKTIWLHPTLVGFDLLEFLLHEFHHGKAPHHDEQYVEETSREIADLIWSLRKLIFTED